MLVTLAATIALVSATQTQQTRPANDAAPKLVSKMLAYYSDAKTLSGTINYSVTDGAGKVAVDTTVQYEKPSKLYIRQDKSGGQSMTWTVSSDGKLFSYNAPEHLPGDNQRLIEKVAQRDGDYDIRKIYGVAAFGSLGDRSVPLDVAIGRKEDLQHIVLSWATVKMGERTKVGAQEVNAVVGQWRQYGEAAVEGTYQLLITDEGKLVQYTIDRYIPDANGNPKYRFIENWDVNLEINGKVDPKLFTLIR